LKQIYIIITHNNISKGNLYENDKNNILHLANIIWRCSWIVICVCLHIVMSNTYCVVFLFCLSSSCAHYVASFSGLSIFATKTIFFIWQTLYGGVHGLIDMKLNDRFRIVQLYHGVVRFIELYVCIHCQSISIREYRRGNRKWTIQRNWQHSVHKMKTNKTK
jgi:hypothetical protein